MIYKFYVNILSNYMESNAIEFNLAGMKDLLPKVELEN